MERERKRPLSQQGHHSQATGSVAHPAGIVHACVVWGGEGATREPDRMKVCRGVGRGGCLSGANCLLRCRTVSWMHKSLQQPLLVITQVQVQVYLAWSSPTYDAHKPGGVQMVAKDAACTRFSSSLGAFTTMSQPRRIRQHVRN